MSKKALIVAFLFLVVLGIGGYMLYKANSKGLAGIRILSTPAADVFINEKQVGKTPYDEKYPSGEYVLKLIPQDIATTAASWTGKVNLTAGLLTYVKREMGTSEITSSGEILSLEKIPSNEAQLIVESTPDAATVLVDGQEKGVTPLTLRDVLAGEHEVAVSSPGFISRSVRAQVTAGYKLTTNFQLALANIIEPTVTPTQAEATSSAAPKEATPAVTIKDTPTGFLRVRSTPSTAASEVGQVEPGKTFPLIDEKDGWYKIAYEQGKEGWISGRYAEKK